jgi:hypothetical protein
MMSEEEEEEEESELSSVKYYKHLKTNVQITRNEYAHA